MSPADKAEANHIYNRVRIYTELIEVAEQQGDFKEAERLEKTQDELRMQLRKLIF